MSKKSDFLDNHMAHVHHYCSADECSIDDDTNNRKLNACLTALDQIETVLKNLKQELDNE